MAHGASIRTASTAERPPAALAGTPQRSMVITAIPPVHGASTVIPSIDVRKPAPAAVHLPTIMLTIRIAMVHGYLTVKPSISVLRRARLVATAPMSTQTTPTRTVTASATIAVRPFR